MVYPASSQVTQVSGSMCDTSDYSCCFRETLIFVSFRWHITFISIKFDENHVNSRHFKKFTANWKNRGIHTVSVTLWISTDPVMLSRCTGIHAYKTFHLQDVLPSVRFTIRSFWPGLDDSLSRYYATLVLSEQAKDGE